MNEGGIMEFVSIIVYILVGISALVLFSTSPILSILIIAIALIIYLSGKINNKLKIKRIQGMSNEEIFSIIEDVLNRPSISITPWVSQKWFPLSKDEKLNWIRKNEEIIRYYIPKMNSDVNTLRCLQKIDNDELEVFNKPENNFRLLRVLLVAFIGFIAIIIVGWIMFLTN